MKKEILTLLFAVLCTGTTFAQISILPKIGLNVSGVRFESDKFAPNKDQRGALAGLTLGAEANVALTGPLSFQTGLLYSGKGYSGQEDLSGSYRLNYLEIPLLGKAKFEGGPVDIYLNGGFGLGVLLGGNIDGTWADGRVNYEEKIKLDDRSNGFDRIDANRLDLGFIIGGGINFSLAPGVTSFVDLRYNHSLTDYDREEVSKNRTFTIAVGMELPL